MEKRSKDSDVEPDKDMTLLDPVMNVGGGEASYREKDSGTASADTMETNEGIPSTDTALKKGEGEAPNPDDGSGSSSANPVEKDGSKGSSSCSSSDADNTDKKKKKGKRTNSSLKRAGGKAPNKGEGSNTRSSRSKSSHAVVDNSKKIKRRKSTDSAPIDGNREAHNVGERSKASSSSSMSLHTVVDDTKRNKRKSSTDPAPADGKREAPNMEEGSGSSPMDTSLRCSSPSASVENKEENNQQISTDPAPADGKREAPNMEERSGSSPMDASLGCSPSDASVENKEENNQQTSTDPAPADGKQEAPNMEERSGSSPMDVSLGCSSSGASVENKEEKQVKESPEPALKDGSGETPNKSVSRMIMGETYEMVVPTTYPSNFSEPSEIEISGEEESSSAVSWTNPTSDSSRLPRPNEVFSISDEESARARQQETRIEETSAERDFNPSDKFIMPPPVFAKKMMTDPRRATKKPSSESGRKSPHTSRQQERLPTPLPDRQRRQRERVQDVVGCLQLEAPRHTSRLHRQRIHIINNCLREISRIAEEEAQRERSSQTDKQQSKRKSSGTNEPQPGPSLVVSPRSAESSTLKQPALPKLAGSQQGTKTICAKIPISKSSLNTARRCAAQWQPQPSTSRVVSPRSPKSKSLSSLKQTEKSTFKRKRPDSPWPGKGPRSKKSSNKSTPAAISEAVKPGPSSKPAPPEPAGSQHDKKAVCEKIPVSKSSLNTSSSALLCREGGSVQAGGSAQATECNEHKKRKMLTIASRPKVKSTVDKATQTEGRLSVVIVRDLLIRSLVAQYLSGRNDFISELFRLYPATMNFIRNEYAKFRSQVATEHSRPENQNIASMPQLPVWPQEPEMEPDLNACEPLLTAPDLISHEPLQLEPAADPTWVGPNDIPWQHVPGGPADLMNVAVPQGIWELEANPAMHIIGLPTEAVWPLPEPSIDASFRTGLRYDYDIHAFPRVRVPYEIRTDHEAFNIVPRFNLEHDSNNSAEEETRPSDQEPN